MYKTVWVTGGTGLVGKAISNCYPNYTEDAKFLFTGRQLCNLLDRNQVDKFMYENQVDAIIHLAPDSVGIAYSQSHHASLMRDNILINFNVLESAAQFNVKKVVMTLTTGMYGNLPQPIKEEYIHDGRPHDSNYGFAFAKRLIEPMIRAYREEYELNVIGLIPNGIFGEHANFGEGSVSVCAMIKRFYHHRNGTMPISVWGDGSPMREFTYVSDIAWAYLWALDNYNEPQCLHIGSAEEHSIAFIAGAIAGIMGIDENRIVFDMSKPNGILRRSTDNSRFVKLSGFRHTPFMTALYKTILWFKENYDKGLVRL